MANREWGHRLFRPAIRHSLFAIRQIGKREDPCQMAAPPGGEGDFGDRGAFQRVDHGGGGGDDGAVLGGGGAAPAEDEDVASLRLARGNLDEMTVGGFEQSLAALRLGPVTGVGGERLRLRAIELAPDAADEADAVGADALEAGLVVVGRAEPGAGDCGGRGASGRHEHQREWRVANGEWKVASDASPIRYSPLAIRLVFTGSPGLATARM